MASSYSYKDVDRAYRAGMAESYANAWEHRWLDTILGASWGVGIGMYRVKFSNVQCNAYVEQSEIAIGLHHLETVKELLSTRQKFFKELVEEQSKMIAEFEKQGDAYQFNEIEYFKNLHERYRKAMKFV